MIKDYLFIKRLFKNERPDIVNTHGNADSKLVLPAAFKAEIPCRVLSRHISAHVRGSWFNKKLYTQYANFVFTTAGYTTRHLKDIFKLKDIQVFSIPSGIIPPQELMPKAQARQNLIDTFDLEKNTRFIGFVGRVSYDKGVSTAIEAFKRIQIRLPDYHLVIVGGGRQSHVNTLKAQAASLGIKDKVHFTGCKENVWPYYRALDCKILASRNINGIPFEGVPQALLESMYCKCPVIGSKSGGIPDIIENGKTGLLFNIDYAGELADLIMQTITYADATASRVKTAREKVEKHHTIDAMGQTILKIYKLNEIRTESPTSAQVFDPYLE